VVKSGVHEETATQVALKLLEKTKIGASSEKQVQRELDAMLRLQHPNIIRLFTADWNVQYPKKNGKTENKLLIVLEYAEGGELFEYLAATGPFEEEVARTYFHQLISGVAHAHANGVVHRDLKPENLLLDKNFILKLADFGFSSCFQAAAGEAMMYTECGTPGYMAPEMFNNQGYDAVKSDLWACGVIVFIMLAGFPPFQKPHLNDWWFQKLHSGRHHLFWQAHSRTHYFSRSFMDFINKLLCPDPAKRFTVADIISHEWFSGPVISPEELFNELSKRKRVVDEGKMRAEMEKLQQEAGRHEGSGLMEDDLVRGMDGGMDVRAAGDDEMPSGPPGMGVNFGMMVAEAVLEDDGGERWGSAVYDQSPPPFEPTAAPVAYSSFSTTAHPREIMSRVTSVLMAVQARVETQGYKIKARLVTAESAIDLTAEVFSTDSGYIVEFRRISGNSVVYRSLYNTVRQQLADLIVPASVQADVVLPEPIFVEAQ
jgi:hypothetical protein